jgi:hypothetical protein
VLLGDMLLFGWLVVRYERRDIMRDVAIMVPAE